MRRGKQLAALFALIVVLANCTQGNISRQHVQSAKNGDVEAQYLLGQYYSREGAKNRDIGVGWLLLAAEQGNLDAQCSLAHVYVGAARSSLASAIDRQLAYRWLCICRDGLKRLGVQPRQVATGDNDVDRFQRSDLGRNELWSALVGTFVPDLEKRMPPEDVLIARALATTWRPLVRAKP